MMMLLTYKRQIRQTKQWSILISDNPFGQAVSVHILDPIFAIAEVLNFQWVVLAPPELIKMDLSRCFPVFWELELKRSTQGDTDAFDSNGDIYINGGTISVEAASAFDSDGTAQINGCVQDRCCLVAKVQSNKVQKCTSFS